MLFFSTDAVQTFYNGEELYSQSWKFSKELVLGVNFRSANLKQD